MIQLSWRLKNIREGRDTRWMNLPLKHCFACSKSNDSHVLYAFLCHSNHGNVKHWTGFVRKSMKDTKFMLYDNDGDSTKEFTMKQIKKDLTESDGYAPVMLFYVRETQYGRIIG